MPHLRSPAMDNSDELFPFRPAVMSLCCEWVLLSSTAEPLVPLLHLIRAITVALAMLFEEVEVTTVVWRARRRGS